jgi:deoxyribodipyrimidine photo-lyase
VKSHSGHLLVEPWTVKTRGGDWFKVFTPFWKAASTTLDDLAPALPVPTGVRGASKSVRSDDLDSYGLKPSNPDWAGSFRTTWMPGEAGARARLAGFLDRRLNRYAAERDYPGADATSNLSPHLRFGEISVRTVWHAAGHYSAAHGVREAALNKFRSELGWREFSYHLLFHFPDLGWRNFQGRFDGFPWDDANPLVRAWQLGQTGYPIVDAGMRQLWATGTIHNRVRMVVGSFLVKHLLVHWTVGENWFWDTLCDADVANNAAGWQWVAGSGADAAPFFRVFNPVLQGEKFDPDGSYVRTWVPELAKMPSEFLHKPWLAPDVILRNSGVHLGRSYPEPIVDHQKARDRALAAFERIKAAA